MVLAAAIPIPFPPWFLGVPDPEGVSIAAAADPEVPASSAAEIWVVALTLNGRDLLGSDEVEWRGRWTHVGAARVSVGDPTAAVHVHPRGGGRLYVELLRHPWSGAVTLRGPHKEMAVNLRAPGSDTRWFWFTLPTPLPRLVFCGLMLLLVGAIVGGALLALTWWVASGSQQARVGTCHSRAAWLGFALPMWAVWSCYALAFQPAIMTPDSVTQWSEAQSGQFRDWHPAAHSMVLWLVARVWNNPSAVVLLHIAILGALLGGLFVFFARRGVPRRVLAVLTALLALSPVTGIMNACLWKDVSYTIALLGLTVVVLAAVETRGAALGSRRGVAALMVTAFAVALFRHNGPAAVVGTLALLILCFPRQRVALLLALAIIVGGVALVRGPLYRALSVERCPSVGLQGTAQHLAAHLSANTPLTAEDRRSLESLGPLTDDWRYTPYDIVPTLFDSSLRMSRIAEAPGETVDVMLRLFRRAPWVNIRHAWEACSMLWRIRDPAHGRFRACELQPAPDDACNWVSDHGGLASKWGVQAHTGCAPLAHMLRSIGLASMGPSFVWWVWRPALYLYVALWVCAAAALRARNWRHLLLAVPLVVHTGFLALCIPAQEFRYEYIAYLAVFALAPLLWMPRINHPGTGM